MSRVLMRLPKVAAKTGLTINEIYERQKAGTFPASVPIGARTVAWVESEIEQWIEECIAQRDSQSLEQVRDARRRKAGPGRGHKGPMGPMPQIETTEI